MGRNSVLIRRAEKYNNKSLRKIIEEIFQHWQLDSSISKGDNVLLKINLLRGAQPEEVVTTHPAIVETVAEVAGSCGARVIVGDSPGGPFKKTLLKRHYRKSGFIAGAEKGLFDLSYNTGSSELKTPEGKRAKSLPVADYIREADFIINLPKLKTHGLTRYTGAVKNMFGAVPGLKKAEYHLKFPAARDMTHLFLDIYQAVKPDLNILDGVIGMEGAGPGSGKPRNFGAIAAAENGILLDLIISYLLVNNIEFWQEPLPAACKERGIEFSPGSYKVPDWLQEELTGAAIPKIEKSKALLSNNWPKIIRSLVNKLLRPRPEFIDKNCVGCGKCQESCPPDVIKIENGKARAELSDCIRCFCCQEICPHRAVEINRPLLSKLFFS